MAIIYTYPLKPTPIMTDSVVITDSADDNKTKITSLQALFNAGLPGTGTVTSVKLDFNPAATGDTGLRLAAGASDQTITTSGSFDVGGTLYSTHGGTGQSAYLTGDILYAPSAISQTLSKLPIGTPGQVLTVSVGNIPSWAAGGGTGTVTTITTANNIGASSGVAFAASPNPLTTTGTITLGFAGTIGDILYADTAASLNRLAAGTATHVLTSNGPGTAPSWQAGGGGGATGKGFSPVPVAVCDVSGEIGVSTHIYLTIAEHDMTIDKCTIWGSGVGLTGDMEVGLYRYGAGWGTVTNVLIGKAVRVGNCIYGPNDLTFAAEGGQNLDVTAGEWIMVGVRNKDSEPNYNLAAHNGLSDKMFGVASVNPLEPFPTPGPSPESEGWGAGNIAIVTGKHFI
jgi:hypothetical protein